MSSLGRGRGRLPQQVNGGGDALEPLRRPNMATVGRGKFTVPAASVANFKFSEVETAVANLDIDTLALFTALDSFLRNKDTSDEDLRTLVKRIVEKVLLCQTNADCISRCIYLASKHKEKGETLYVAFFDELEKRFTDVEGIQEKYGGGSLWRFVHFFSSVCHFVRNLNIAPMTELVDGLNKLCLDLQQPISSDQYKIASLAIARCCLYLQLSKKDDQVTVLQNKLRDLVQGAIGSVDSSKSLLWLTLGLESSLVKLSHSTVQYYSRGLGPEAALFLLQVPPVNLPSYSRPYYHFEDISYTVNFC